MVFRMKTAADEERAEDWHKRHCNDCRSHHRKCFRECERMEELPFHSSECKDRDESEDDDRHRKENWAPHERRGPQRDLSDLAAILPMFLEMLLGMPEN